MKLEGFLNEARMEDPFDVVEELYAVSYPYIKEYLKAVRPDYRAKFLLSGRAGNDVRAIKKIRKNREPKDTPYEAHSEIDDMFLDMFGERYRSNSVFCTSTYSQANGYGDNVYGLFPLGMDYGYCWSSYISDLYSYIIDSGDYDFQYFTWEPSEVVGDLRDSGEGDEHYEDIVGELREEFQADNDPSDYFDDLDEISDEYDEDDQQRDAQDMFDDAEQAYVDDFADERLTDVLINIAEERVDQCYQNVRNEIDRYQDDDLRGALDSGSEVMLTGKSYLMIRADYLPYVMRYMEYNGSKKPTKELFVKAMEGVDLTRYVDSKYKKSVKRHFKKFITDDLLKMMDDLKA